jgi:hypothetical protein
MASEVQGAREGYRAPEDDFFCEKYGVWYPRIDCNYRVANATYEGCVDCFQGRVNLRWLRPGSRPDPGAANNLIRFPVPAPPATTRDDEAGTAPQEF